MPKVGVEKGYSEEASCCGLVDFDVSIKNVHLTVHGNQDYADLSRSARNKCNVDTW